MKRETPPEPPPVAALRNWTRTTLPRIRYKFDAHPVGVYYADVRGPEDNPPASVPDSGRWYRVSVNWYSPHDGSNWAGRRS